MSLSVFLHMKNTKVDSAIIRLCLLNSFLFNSSLRGKSQAQTQWMHLYYNNLEQ